MLGENGILIINKAKDFTSHDCVNVIRRALKIKRVGHTGTLDPMATGVLPVCVGKATKIADFISLGDKKYTASFQLGVKTDTQDITGAVIERRAPVTDPSRIREAVNSFAGRIKQIPPMYSAKKVRGKKLYELARKGIEIEREPVEIEIYSIDLISINEDIVTMDVHCSKGTYIRTLIDDIGNALGCYATMTSLKRTKNGIFEISDRRIIDILDVDKHAKSMMINNMISIDKLFLNYPQRILPYNQEIRFKNGAPLTENELGLLAEEAHENDIYRIYNTVGEFLALGIIAVTPEGRMILRSHKTFY